ncbi:hypothetical protein BKA61DRAFT_147676 [Leptodontidium sp. MPI-SDFR-AT-0119]|nr:hypothetical protein BKA61DRAFT_147676 [Leptodontidium sp. MPI-SDFR-AT-0119]
MEAYNHRLIHIPGLAGIVEGPWDTFAKQFPNGAVRSVAIDFSTLSRSTFTVRMSKHAKNLIELVVTNNSDKPVVLCGYGLGGLVIQMAVVNSYQSRAADRSSAQFLRQINGVILLSTPIFADSHALEAHLYKLDQIGMCDKISYFSVANNLKLKDNTSVAVADIEETFFQVARERRISIVRYFERLPVVTRDKTLLITESEPSSDFIQSRYLDGNHLTLCRFTNTSMNYKLLCGSVAGIVDPSDRSWQSISEDSKHALDRRQLTSEANRARNPLSVWRVSYYEEFRSVLDILHDALPRPKRALGRVINTCVWVESSPAYQAWKGSEDQKDILLIVGPLGSGKTTLARYLSECCATFGIMFPCLFNSLEHPISLNLSLSDDQCVWSVLTCLNLFKFFNFIIPLWNFFQQLSVIPAARQANENSN